MKTIALMICLLTVSVLSSQESNKDTICISRSIAEKCLSIQFERNQCLERETALVNITESQSDQIYSLEQLLELSEEKYRQQAAQQQQQITILKRKKRNAFFTGTAAGITLGVVLSIIIR